MIDSTNWSGVLSIDNLEEVAAAIAERLNGRYYTFVTQNKYFGPEHKEECKYQCLAPEKTVSGKALSTWTASHEDGEVYGAFHVTDSYGSWGAATFRDAHIDLTPKQIIIDQRMVGGHRTKWTIILE